MTYLLDTNIVSYLLKRNKKVEKKLGDVILLGEEVFISCITYYEVKRGLLAVNATRQLADFKQLCSDYEVLYLDDLEIIEQACQIHTNLKKVGKPIQDADVLIAAMAITRGLILVSNDSDMLRVDGIDLENWLEVES